MLLIIAASSNSFGVIIWNTDVPTDKQTDQHDFVGEGNKLTIT